MLVILVQKLMFLLSFFSAILVFSFLLPSTPAPKPIKKTSAIVAKKTDAVTADDVVAPIAVAPVAVVEVEESGPKTRAGKGKAAAAQQ